jgi:hypothetical protein
VTTDDQRAIAKAASSGPTAVRSLASFVGQQSHKLFYGVADISVDLRCCVGTLFVLLRPVQEE